MIPEIISKSEPIWRPFAPVNSASGTHVFLSQNPHQGLSRTLPVWQSASPFGNPLSALGLRVSCYDYAPGFTVVNNNPLNAVDPTGKHDVDCSWDYCGHGGWGGGGGGAIIDGVPQTIFNTSGLGSNALAACPNNFCSGFAQTQGGSTQFVQYRVSAGLGPQGYQTMQQMNTANYEVNGQFATAGQYQHYQAEVAAQHAFAAYLLDCQHSATPCNGNDQVTTRYQGLAGNYALANSTLNSASVTGMIPDPLTGEHFGNPSWYDWSLIGTGHVATFNGNVESHFDTFSPIFLTPLHFLFDVLPSYFINPKPGVPGPTYTCSPGLGCH